MLILCCFALAFSSFSKWGLLQCHVWFLIAEPGLGVWDSVFTASGLQNLGSVIVAPHVESPRTKDQTCLLCMVRWILTHCANAHGLQCFLNSTLLRCGPCKHTDPSLCWMSFYAVNSWMITIQVKLQDIPGTQMAPSGPSHVVPLISHCFSDTFLDFM